ncbi:MAG: RNase adapter RapZ [Thermodesulfobacteriota bacterium]
MTHIVILSGLSGSGKSTAVKALEDIGYFCVDNLPPSLLPKFVELCSSSQEQISKAALVIDAREGTFFEASLNLIKQLREREYKFELLFLDSSNETIVKRYKETRRRHPLSKNGTILEGIEKEREMLSELSKFADNLIDTSSLNVHQLRDIIQDRYGKVSDKTISIDLMSFGTKYGYPYDADIVIDVRFLENPNFIEHLKELNGLDDEVIDFVIKLEDCGMFIDKLVDLFEFLIPRYEHEGKSYLTIALGCTGGKHRSVVLVNEISKKLKQYSPRVRHRDILKN